MALVCAKMGGRVFWILVTIHNVLYVLTTRDRGSAITRKSDQGHGGAKEKYCNRWLRNQITVAKVNGWRRNNNDWKAEST